MEKILICEGKYGFHTGKKVIYLSISLDNIPDKIEVEGFTLLRRSEFHVSLVCIKKIIEQYNIQILDFEDKILEDFCEFAKEKEVKFLKYKNEFKFVDREGKKTVVVMCEILHLESFFKTLNQKYFLNIETPPTHVTLYTLDGEAGIYLISSKDIKNFTKPINNPLGRNL